MIIKRTHVLAAMLWLLSIATVSGQVGFSLPTFTNTSTGQQLDLPIKVVNFDTVFSIQYVIQWNPAVLEFISILKPSNPLGLMDSTNFSYNFIGDGLLRFYWYSLTPRTLEDGKDIFHLSMKVVGNNGTSSPVIFTETPPVTYFEVVRGPGNQFYTLSNSLLTNGFVGVGIVPIFEPNEAQLSIQASPNPFSESTVVRFDLPESGSTRLLITDVAGKICYEEKKYLNSGRNGTEIAKSQLQGKGMYFVHLFTASAHVVQPIVLQ